MAGHAATNAWLAFSAALIKEDLVAIFHGVPPWHWSMSSAMAKKAWHSAWHTSCGFTTTWRKCLMIGKIANTSEAVQENLNFFLHFSNFFLENKVCTYAHLYAAGN